MDDDKQIAAAPDMMPATQGSRAAYNIAVGDAGVVMPATFGDMVEFAKMMAKADLAIPKHLRNNPGACLAVAMRSRAWRLDPFAVATKTYSVNDQLAYEAQLVIAVINRNAPIKDRLVPIFTGEKATRKCRIEPSTADGQPLPYESPQFSDITPKNSPLWKNDPDQQLFYYSARAWCRRYFPELLLGVYDREEAQDMKDVTPNVNYTDDSQVQHGEVLPPEAPVESEIPLDMQIKNLVKGVENCTTKVTLHDLLRDSEPFLSMLKTHNPDASKAFWQVVTKRQGELTNDKANP